ncbi:MAG TPA: tetratricopeptide repeat protein, partial [Terriglobia bacterium]|nr:tetratricopeptide repeat protein [Terriglobia bacterium]
MCILVLAGARHYPACPQGKGVLQDSPADVTALVELGSMYAEQGKPGLAEPLLARAVRADPHSALARLEWATVLSKLHRYLKASAALQGAPAPAARDKHIAYERLKASIDLGLGHAGPAAADMERALELAPADAGLQFATGVAENQAGNWPRAIQLLGPIFQATHNEQCGLLLIEAQLSARQSYRATLAALRAVSLPLQQEFALRVDISRILAEHRLYAEAAKDLDRAVSLEPGYAELLYDLALVDFRAGETRKALAAAERAKTIQDNASLESLLGEIQEGDGDSLGAVRSFQSAVALDPRREEYRLELGLELLRHETLKPALLVFRQGAQLFPRSYRMRVALGLTEYLLQDYRRATQTLLGATALNPNPSLADAYLGATQLEGPLAPDPGAVRYLCGYASAHQENATAEAYCGAVLARIEHDRGAPAPSSEALRRLSEAVARAPSSSIARCQLGKTLEWAQQWILAQKQLEACIKLDPDSPDAYYLLAQVYKRLGENRRAMQEITLHQQAALRMARANGHRDRAVKRFLFS